MQAEFDFEQLLFPWVYESIEPGSTGKTSRARAGYVESGIGQGQAPSTANQYEVRIKDTQHEQSGQTENGEHRSGKASCGCGASSVG